MPTSILEKILNSAAEQFTRFGFKTITMDDIARHAGVSKKTLYQHFETKLDIIVAAVTHFHTMKFERCLQHIKKASNAVEAMVLVTDDIQKMHQEINPIALLELQKYYTEAFLMFKKTLLEKDLETIKQNLQQGIEEGLYRSDMNIDVMAFFRLEFTLWLLQSSNAINHLSNAFYSIERELLDHFMYGIVTEKGRQLYDNYKKIQA
jgi:AcrR family transcriptional regulator